MKQLWLLAVAAGINFAAAGLNLLLVVYRVVDESYRPLTTVNLLLSPLNIAGGLFFLYMYRELRKEFRH